MVAKKKRKGGRPSKYETHVLPRMIEIEGWARDGLIDEQIAKNLGVAYSTFMTYKKKYSELSEALKRGKEVVDREVENALLRNALGYDFVEEEAVKLKQVYYVDGKRYEDERVEVVELRKHRTADTTAQIFWLKNRKPKEWRDKQEVEHSGNLGVQIIDNIPDVTDDEDDED